MSVLERLLKPISLLLITSLLFCTGCPKKSEITDPTAPEVYYKDAAQVALTGSDGRINIRSSIVSGGEMFDVELQVGLRDQSGNPLDGMEVLYAQENGKIILRVRDPKGRVVPGLFIGTPRELQNYFGSGALSGTSSPSHASLSKTTAIWILIGALIFLASVTYAELKLIKNVYEIDRFYLTDAVSEGNDYVMYCKTFEEIADLIKNRYLLVTGATSVMVSYMTLGAGGLPSTGSGTALYFGEKAATLAANSIRDALVQKAISDWGLAASDLTGRKVAVRIYPYDEHATFSNVRNLFAVMALDYRDARCSVQGDAISGVVSEAVNGNPLQGVLVRLSGQANRSTLTDASGAYSFPSLSAGNYTVTASLSGYITDTKSVSTNGSPIVVNFVLSKTLPSGQYRFILQWGANPHDLDGHFTGPLSTGGRFHMYWYYAPQYNRTNPWSSIVAIDRDDTTGNGFETTTLYQQISGTYRYSVHDYSNASSTYSYSLSQSGASVSIYKGSSLIQRYTVPTSREGTLWTVFEMSGSTISPINTMSYQWDPSLIQKAWISVK